VVPGAVTVGVFLLTSLSWGLGWRTPTAGSPAEAVSLAPLSWAAAGLRAAGVAGETVNALVTAVSAVLIVAGIAWVWVRLGPRGLSTRAAASRGVPLEERGDPLPILAAGPALQPWYATWLIPVVALCVVPRRAWLVGVAALLLLPALQDVLPPPLALLALAPLALALRRPRAQISA
jgi:alpha-1,6-mannosyltransferase